MVFIAKQNYMFRPIAAIFKFLQLLCLRVLYKCLNRVEMLRSHHHLRGFVKLVLWDVYCVNGYGSFWLGYVGVGFGRKCDCRYGILYAPMLGGGGFCVFGYSDIFSLFFGTVGADYSLHFPHLF